MMTRIEQALEQPFALAQSATAPPRLMAAMRHAVFPGGARIRPQLCLAVARACGEDAPELTNAAAVGIELLHCASLVHDDMPCFDDADTRRGLATVHKLYGEPLALLAGLLMGNLLPALAQAPAGGQACAMIVMHGKWVMQTASLRWRPATRPATCTRPAWTAPP